MGLEHGVRQETFASRAETVFLAVANAAVLCRQRLLKGSGPAADDEPSNTGIPRGIGSEEVGR